MQVASILKSQKSSEFNELVEGFSKLLDMDLNAFLEWIDSKKADVNTLFYEHATKPWYKFLNGEMKHARETLENIKQKRNTRVLRTQRKKNVDASLFQRYCTKTTNWIASVQKMEQTRFTKHLYDQQLTTKFIAADWQKFLNELSRERGLYGPLEDENKRWKLDFTEARGRLRKKLRRVSLLLFT